MVRPQAWARCTLALSLFAVVSIAGCGEKKPQNTEPEYTAAEKAEMAKQARLDQLEERVSNVLTNAQNSPDRWAELIEVMDAYLLEARWYGSDTAHLVSKLDAARTQVAARRDKAAKEAYAAVLEQVEKDIAEEEYDRAAERLAGFDPQGLFAETDIPAQAEAKRAEVALYAEAALDSSGVLREAAGYFREGHLESVGRAVAILASFPDEFADTQFGKDIKEQEEEYFERYKELYEEEKVLTAVEPQEIVIEEYLGNFSTTPREGAWTVEDDELVGENDTSGPAILMFGDKTWRSFRVQFELKAPEDQEFAIGGTLKPSLRPGQQKVAEMKAAATVTDDWITVVLTLRNGRLRIQDLTNSVNLVDEFSPRGIEGTVAIGLTSGQKIRIRNIQAYVFEKAGGDSDEDDPDSDNNNDNDDNNGTGN